MSKLREAIKKIVIEESWNAKINLLTKQISDALKTADDAELDSIHIADARDKLEDALRIVKNGYS